MGFGDPMHVHRIRAVSARLFSLKMRSVSRVVQPPLQITPPAYHRAANSFARRRRVLWRGLHVLFRAMTHEEAVQWRRDRSGSTNLSNGGSSV